nr:MAG TPA: hypothetical protein [Caudoviricetes sp.]
MSACKPLRSGNTGKIAKDITAGFYRDALSDPICFIRFLDQSQYP